MAAHIEQVRGPPRADLVVVLSHLGLPQDVKLAGEVDGIDVVISGHTHNRLREPVWVGRTPIIQSRGHGSFVGRLDLVVDGRAVVDVWHRCRGLAMYFKMENLRGSRRRGAAG